MIRPTQCTMPDCDDPHKAKGWCRKHYKRWQRYGDPNITMHQASCTMPDCAGHHIAKGYCWKHYQRWRRWGDPNITQRLGPTPLTATPAMIRAYESGLTIKEIAKRFDLEPDRLGKALRRAGAKRQFCRNGHELAVVGIYRPPNGRLRCKACYLTQMHKWKEANREQVRAFFRAYYLANRDKLLAASRKRHDAHRIRPWKPRARRLA